MSKRLFILATAAAALAAGSAAAQALPDFPTDAQPGGCYARLPAGTALQFGPAAGPAVWTLKRGTGPTAVWSYSHVGEPVVGLGSGPLEWARVDCASGRPLGPVRYAAAPPPPSPPPAPPPPFVRPAYPRVVAPGPMARLEPSPPPPPAFAPRRFEFDAPPPPPRMGDPSPYADPAPAGPPPHGMPPSGFGPAHGGPPPMMGPGPYAQGPVPLPPMAGPHAGPFGPMAHHGVPPHRAFAPRPPERPPVAPWFGGRMLTWPGKTLR